MNTSDILLKHDVKPSVIRIMVYDYLKSTVSHPSADDIYHKLSPKVATLSKTSVYNTVKLFAKKGLIKQLPIEASQLRYDADTKYHGHFWCNKCKNVYDFKLNDSTDTELSDFDIEHKEVFYTGVCKSCR